MSPLFKHENYTATQTTQASGPEVLQPQDSSELAASTDETPDMTEATRVLAMLQSRRDSIRERLKGPQREVGVIHLTAGFATIRTHRSDTQS